jgi:hypothetical protein
MGKGKTKQLVLSPTRHHAKRLVAPDRTLERMEIPHQGVERERSHERCAVSQLALLHLPERLASRSHGDGGDLGSFPTEVVRVAVTVAKSAELLLVRVWLQSDPEIGG